MDYAEASYFDGYHFQHIARYLEKLRLDRIKRKCDHAFRKTPYNVGMCVVYECMHCGEEYEKDVS